jgi:hypothetical protein
MIFWKKKLYKNKVGEKFDIKKTKFMIKERSYGTLELIASINISIFHDIWDDKLTCKIPKNWRFYGLVPTREFYIEVKNEKDALKQKDIFLKQFKLRKTINKEI